MPQQAQDDKCPYSPRLSLYTPLDGMDFGVQPDGLGRQPKGLDESQRAREVSLRVWRSSR